MWSLSFLFQLPAAIMDSDPVECDPNPTLLCAAFAVASHHSDRKVTSTVLVFDLESEELPLHYEPGFLLLFVCVCFLFWQGRKMSFFFFFNAMPYFLSYYVTISVFWTVKEAQLSKVRRPWGEIRKGSSELTTLVDWKLRKLTKSSSLLFNHIILV